MGTVMSIGEISFPLAVDNGPRERDAGKESENKSEKQQNDDQIHVHVSFLHS